MLPGPGPENTNFGNFLPALHLAMQNIFSTWDQAIIDNYIQICLESKFALPDSVPSKFPN